MTRARTSTSREPAVCAAYSKVCGRSRGSASATFTSGGGMPAPGPPFFAASLPPGPAAGPHAASEMARIEQAMTRINGNSIGACGRGGRYATMLPFGNADGTDR